MKKCSVIKFCVLLMILLTVISSFATTAYAEEETTLPGQGYSIVAGNGTNETIAPTESSDNSSSFTKENIVWIIVLLVLLVLCVGFMIRKKTKDHKLKKSSKKE